MECKGCERVADWPSYKSNADISAQLRPKQFETYITDNVAFALASTCFKFEGKDRYQQFLPDQQFTPRSKPPEYLVDINYEEELHQDLVRTDGKKVLKSSNLTVSLYYNGTSGKEHVQSWNTAQTFDDYSGFKPDNLPDSWMGVEVTVRRMCRYKNSPLNKIKPIENTVLLEFEKQPSDCEIELEKEVCPGEEINVTIGKIRDTGGRPSREFNRIVVTALEGEIIGGAEIENFPKYHAFLVGDEPVEFRYKAPTEEGIADDKITVFNSCDIARVDQFPLQKTMPKDEIQQKNIEIKACYDSIVKVTKKEFVTENGEKTTSIGSGTNTFRRDYQQITEATVHVKLEQTRTVPMPMYNEYYEYYKIKGIELNSFRASLKDEEYDYFKDKNHWSEKTETWEGISTQARIMKMSIMLLEMQEIYSICDSETKKVKAVLIPGAGIEYNFKKKFLQEGEGGSASGPWNYSHSSEEEDTKIFDIAPVNEEKPYTDVSNIPSPDFIVTSEEDNKASGSGTVIIDDCSHSRRDYTTCKTKSEFSWEFIRYRRK